MASSAASKLRLRTYLCRPFHSLRTLDTAKASLDGLVHMLTGRFTFLLTGARKHIGTTAVCQWIDGGFYPQPKAALWAWANRVCGKIDLTRNFLYLNNFRDPGSVESNMTARTFSRTSSVRKPGCDFKIEVAEEMTEKSGGQFRKLPEDFAKLSAWKGQQTGRINKLCWSTDTGVAKPIRHNPEQVYAKTCKGSRRNQFGGCWTRKTSTNLKLDGHTQ